MTTEIQICSKRTIEKSSDNYWEQKCLIDSTDSAFEISNLFMNKIQEVPNEMTKDLHGHFEGLLL